jgi:hypothetical protein
MKREPKRVRAPRVKVLTSEQLTVDAIRAVLRMGPLYDMSVNRRTDAERFYRTSEEPFVTVQGGGART